ncbi:hypothetical protein MAPG_06032 [Magnaporthiopsis poae ATCC 64411]|uniref:Lipocalin-like domain-containing protein n=1 Tax=Magnaporthiopsis poae (strain ATCC 64411 / 73-15) TaxID=644358 RepID=A0A0C4E0Z0_MAGP6|nr:hypothetical protein MAPG_06032 [Magnaporthiopsis poae ATCC 64411]
MHITMSPSCLPPSRPDPVGLTGYLFELFSLFFWLWCRQSPKLATSTFALSSQPTHLPLRKKRNSRMVKITGVWNLVSFNVYLNGTIVRQPNGPHPLGKAIILPGYISFHITTPEAAVPLPNETRWRDGTDHDIAEIARPHVSYCGRWTAAYLGEQLQLTTTVDVSLDPSWIPRPQRRNASFVEENGKSYMLLMPVDSVAANNSGEIGVLKWEREVIKGQHKVGTGSISAAELFI